MADKPLVSVIIINFNGKRYIRSCLDSLLAGGYKNIEIIFVDNGSSDGSLDFVRTSYPQIKIVDNQVNLGLAVASNKGASLARGEYLFFYNNDTIADKNLIDNLVKRMEADPLIGISGCRTYTYDGKYLINEGVSCDIFAYPYAKGKTFYVDAGIFIRRKVFKELGGFDEKMFLYGEDRDICWRCWLYGYKVEVVPQAIFFHDSACITRDIRQYSTSINKRFLGEFNALRSILKNYSLITLSFIVPAFMAINIAEILCFALQGQGRVVKNVYLRSYLENMKGIRDILSRRRLIQRQRRISDFALLGRMAKISGKLRLFMAMGIPRFAGDIKYAAK